MFAFVVRWGKCSSFSFVSLRPICRPCISVFVMWHEQLELTQWPGKFTTQKRSQNLVFMLQKASMYAFFLGFSFKKTHAIRGSPPPRLFSQKLCAGKLPSMLATNQKKLPVHKSTWTLESTKLPKKWLDDACETYFSIFRFCTDFLMEMCFESLISLR